MQRNHVKPATPAPLPSKALVLNWLRSLFPDLPPSSKIEDFGDGVIYCRILNNYYGHPSLHKITWHPKNQYEYANNLRLVQTILLEQKILIPMDVAKVSKRKFLQNWQLINIFYKQFCSRTEEANTAEDKQNIMREQPIINHKLTHNFSKTPNKSHYQCPSIEKYQHTHEQPNLLKKQSNRYLESPQQQNLLFNQHELIELAKNSLKISQYINSMHAYKMPSSVPGKLSVGSQMFHNSQSASIDRIKQIVLKPIGDVEKVKQVRMILGIPVEEEKPIKIEEDEIGQILYPHIDDKTTENSQMQHNQVKIQPTPQKQIKFFGREHHFQGKQSCGKASVSKISKKPFKI